MEQEIYEVYSIKRNLIPSIAVYYMDYDFFVYEPGFIESENRVRFTSGVVSMYDNSVEKAYMSSFAKNDLIFLRRKKYIWLLEVLTVGMLVMEARVITSNILNEDIASKHTDPEISRDKDLMDKLFESVTTLKLKPKTPFFETQKRSNPYFYHFTSIENFDEILKIGKLTSKNKTANQIKDIANNEIQNRRRKMEVNVNSGTTVHDYVPFYFTKQSSMFFERVLSKVIDQKDTIFLAVNFEKLRNANVYFTDSSANTEDGPNFYYKLESLEKLNWEKINCELKKSYDKDISEDQKSLIRRQRMAEVLVYNFVPLEWIEKIIVFNQKMKEYCEKEIRIIRPDLKIEVIVDNITRKSKNGYEYHNKEFYYTKNIEGVNFSYFRFSNEKKGSLSQKSYITGPKELLKLYCQTINTIIKNRKNSIGKKYKFKNINQLVEKIDKDFSVLPELEGIEGLQSSNYCHVQTVSEHTKEVVENVRNSAEFVICPEKEKDILCLSAYLHDIGKGPKNKWYNGEQRVWPDHPAEALPMVERILSDEIENIDTWEVKRIVLLVAYHDLLGEIAKGGDKYFNYNGRSIDELRKLKLSKDEFKDLKILSEADIEAINHEWLENFKKYVDDIEEKSKK